MCGISYVFLYLPGGSLFGVALLFIYVGGIAILAFFFLMIYGKWFYQLTQAWSYSKGWLTVEPLVVDWELVLFVSYSLCVYEGLIGSIGILADVIVYNMHLQGTLTNLVGSARRFETYSTVLTSAYLCDMDWIIMWDEFKVINVMARQWNLSGSGLFTVYGGLFIELLGLLLLFVLLNAILIFLGIINVVFNITYYQNCQITG